MCVVCGHLSLQVHPTPTTFPLKSFPWTSTGSRNELRRQTLESTWVGNFRAQFRRKGVGSYQPYRLQNPQGEAQPSEVWAGWKSCQSGLRIRLLFNFLNSDHLTNYLGCLAGRHTGSYLPNQDITENKNPLALDKYELFVEILNCILPEQIV